MKALLVLLSALPLVALSPFAVSGSAEARYSNFYRQRLSPINREGFYWINHLGNGVDDNGYYNRPVRSTDAFGAELPNGWNYSRLQWDDQGTAALYYVKDGYIIQQDYQWSWGVQ